MSEGLNKYWENGENYNRYITNELNSFRKEAWKKQICDHFPAGRVLKILDLGCGPGFFSGILSEAGHQVTGIDASRGMLKCAKENARKLQVDPTLMWMDINDLTFTDETFDVIVTRNVTWTLTQPEKVYRELYRILKNDGMLLIYDALWHKHLYDPEMYARVQERERRHFEKYGVREVICENREEYRDNLPMEKKDRPVWDKKYLESLSMQVTTQEDIGRWLYEQWEKDLYAEHPLFEICAVKRKQ